MKSGRALVEFGATTDARVSSAGGKLVAAELRLCKVNSNKRVGRKASLVEVVSELRAHFTRRQWYHVTIATARQEAGSVARDYWLLLA